MANGFYYVGGQAYSTGYLLKINEYGDTVWAKYLDEILVGDIISTPDYGCIIGGSGIFTRMDTNGSVLWMKTFISNPTFVREIKKTTDNEYIACGMRNYEQDGVILKFDVNGNLKWLKFILRGQ